MAIDQHSGLLTAAVVLVAVALLGLVLRVMVGNGWSRPARPADEDFGLLRVAALADDAAGAQVVCGLLAAAGIRATVAPQLDGRVRVLVFATDLARARAVVSGPSA